VPAVRDAAAAPPTAVAVTAAVSVLVAMRSGPFAQVMSVRGLVAG